MDEAREMLERLDRVDRLDRAGGPPGELLAELLRLVAAGEAWLRAEGGDERARSALDGARRALAVPPARARAAA
jgi:hypothetical protein